MWGAIIEKLEELEQHSQALDVREDGFDADDPYDPMEFADDDDEFSTSARPPSPRAMGDRQQVVSHTASRPVADGS